MIVVLAAPVNLLKLAGINAPPTRDFPRVHSYPHFNMAAQNSVEVREKTVAQPKPPKAFEKVESKIPIEPPVIVDSPKGVESEKPSESKPEIAQEHPETPSQDSKKLMDAQPVTPTPQVAEPEQVSAPVAVKPKGSHYMGFFLVYMFVLLALCSAFILKHAWSYLNPVEKKPRFGSRDAKWLSRHPVPKHSQQVAFSSLMQSFVTQHEKMNDESFESIEEDRLTADASAR